MGTMKPARKVRRVGAVLHYDHEELPYVQYIAALYLDPRFRGEGLGAEAFAAVLADASERSGRPYVAWVVHPENSPMLNLSCALGPGFATDPRNRLPAIRQPKRLSSFQLKNCHTPSASWVDGKFTK
jgi:RimJ/RimL family protein N-acetyltransferase